MPNLADQHTAVCYLNDAMGKSPEDFMAAVRTVAEAYRKAPVVHGKRRFASPEAAFRWLKLPGMDLVDEAPAPPPAQLVNRCWCGKPISHGRNCCNDCKVAELKNAAACLTTNEALDMFLDSFGGDDRAGLLAELQPYLHITEHVEEVAWRCDCGEVGAIHVRLKDQPDNAIIGMALEFHHNTSPECPIVGEGSKGCSAQVGREGEAQSVLIHEMALTL
jgi:hypothetical protein